MKKKYYFLVFLVVITIFLGSEFFKNKAIGLEILAEKDYLLLKTDNNFWGYGNLKNPMLSDLIKNVNPYFSTKSAQDIFSLNLDKEYHDGDLVLIKISPNIFYAFSKGKNLLFFRGVFSNKDRQSLIKSGVPLKVDWIVLNKNLNLDFLPKPKQGILFIDNKKPHRKFLEKSREKNIPLISTVQTAGFLLKISSGKWVLKTRN